MTQMLQTKSMLMMQYYDTSSFLKKDGSIAMTDNLNLGNKKIVGLSDPTRSTSC